MLLGDPEKLTEEKALFRITNKGCNESIFNKN